MTHLVIAEKDALARDIARAMCGVDDENARMPICGRGYVICACSGHLLELKEPAEVDERYAGWDEDILPIAIYPWPKGPRKGSSVKRLAQIKEQLKRCDGYIYHAGDADDEGQLIVDEVLEHLGYDPTDPRVMRVYVNDSVEANIQRAFAEAKPNAECVNAGKAALARSLADMSFGVSESRLAAKRLGEKVAIGRVQTPTLGLVVERDRVREGHSKREYYTLAADVAEGESVYRFAYELAGEEMTEDGKHVFERSVMEEHAERAKGVTVSFDAEQRNVSEAPPLPYSMTTLTSDMSKRHSLTAKDVMEATQALRDEFGAITYNRSNTCYLKSAHHAEAPETTALAAANIGCTWDIDTTIRSAAFNDKKLEGSPHHAIIPSAKRVDISQMTEKQRTVYTAICERYLVQFLPPATYTETTSQFTVEGIPGTFKLMCREQVEAGWQASAPEGWARMKAKGDAIPLSGTHRGQLRDLMIDAKTTAPPKPFTDGTLVTAMSNVARYAKDAEVRRILLEKDKDDPNEHGSIGTTATRSGIVEGLIKRGYLERRKNALISTSKGRALYDAVPKRIRGIDLTAQWWLIQQEVAAGNRAPDAVMRSVCKEFEEHRADAYEGKTLRTPVGTCPRCGEDVHERGKVYSCSSNKSEKLDDGTWKQVAGCGFKMLPLGGKKLTADQAAKVLSGKKVAVKGLTSSKTGKKYDCTIALDATSDMGVKPIFDATKKKRR